MRPTLYANTTLLLLSAAAIAVLVTGCGGGGSGTPLPTPNLTPTASPTATGEIVAITTRSSSLTIVSLYSEDATTISTSRRPSTVSWFPGKQQVAYGEVSVGREPVENIRRINRNGMND